MNWNWGWPLGVPRNPWRRIADLEADLANAEGALVDAALDLANMQRHCDLLADRYDKVRETNMQLRDTLDLYRDDHRRH